MQCPALVFHAHAIHDFFTTTSLQKELPMLPALSIFSVMKKVADRNLGLTFDPIKIRHEILFRTKN
jgi:hypothetical protein